VKSDSIELKNMGFLQTSSFFCRFLNAGILITTPLFFPGMRRRMRGWDASGPSIPAPAPCRGERTGCPPPPRPLTKSPGTNMTRSCAASSPTGESSKTRTVVSPRRTTAAEPPPQLSAIFNNPRRLCRGPLHRRCRGGVARPAPILAPR
jgi:hypothetical protein